MKSKIQNVLEQLQWHLDYINTNSDYTEQYDILLADDSAYHNEQWEEAIYAALDEAGYRGIELSKNTLDVIIQSIIDNPSSNCYISVEHSMVRRSNDCIVASFPVGELEVQIEEKLSPGQIQYIEKYSDWTYSNGCFYYALDYTTVDYSLKPLEIEETLRNHAQNERETHWEHLLSDARGVYIPRDFLDLEHFKAQLSEREIQVLSDPEHEFYWETWDSILNRDFIVNGETWTLYQDGDLWAVNSKFDNTLWELAA